MKERCGISQTWHLKKHTAGEDVITVMRASNMKTFCLFHRTALALFACHAWSPVQDIRGRISAHVVLNRLNTETRPFSGDGGGDAPPLILAVWPDSVPGESENAGASAAASKTHPGVPSCGGHSRRRARPSRRLRGSRQARHRLGCAAPHAAASSSPLRAFLSFQRGSRVASGSPLETFFERLRDSVAVFAVRFTRSLFYKLTWELKCKASCPF